MNASHEFALLHYSEQLRLARIAMNSPQTLFRCETCKKITATPNWSDESERSLRYDYDGYPIDDGGLVRFKPLCQCGGHCKPFTDSH